MTRLVLDVDSEPDLLPTVRWLGVLRDDETGEPSPLEALTGTHRGSPLLVEHGRGSFTRPGLRGHRIAQSSAQEGALSAGRDWSTAFRPHAPEVADSRLAFDAEDTTAGLTLRTEVESLAGGALRVRHTVTNVGESPYLVDALDVSVPLPDDFSEIVDFTGRHERERVVQRHQLADGLWVRESRGGKPGLDSASVLIAGTRGFGFDHGEIVGVLVASSGNPAMAVQRSGAEGPTLSGGELLLPGEVMLAGGESYSSPWVFVVAARDGLDSLAHALHVWQRSLQSHPPVQPVTLNVWEAVYFDHDLDKLTRLADLAARVGVERFVLDDGWFRGRRHDHTGLGDWTVDEQVWPDGLDPLITHVQGLGMQFGLWFEPEMVNPDSDLYRAHPDWILSTGGRVPRLQRNQLVLDLTNDDVRTYLRDQLDDVLSAYRIDYVKWDHNRELLDAGTSQDGGAPAAHRQSLSHYHLLDELRRLHPSVSWESCSAGGGRIDLGVLEHVQRFWTSDMTDALARQQIQRWTAQFIAPEYLGAHVSAPTSHQTGRTLSLDFRAATALFCAFGIEWDLTQASDDELDRLAAWCTLHKKYRGLLHSGRMVRIETSDPAVLAHGVVADDGESALVAHVQMDDSTHNRGVTLRVPGLRRTQTYGLDWEGPIDTVHLSVAPPLDPSGPTGGAPVNGALLADVGLWIPRRRPETIQLIHIASDPPGPD